MKKLAFLVLVFVFSLLWVACKDDSEITGNFWAQNHSTEKFYQVTAQMLAENSKCEVWVEKGSGVTEAKAQNIANEYEKNIYVKMMNAFGYTINDKNLGIVNTMEIAHYYTTGKTTNAKLTILLLDIKDGYNKPGDPYVGGYFYSADFYTNEELSKIDPNLKSNEREMIYVDTYPSDPESGSSYETLAHEMQHLMNFVSSNVYRKSLMDTWVDEGLSAAAQWIYSGQHPEERWKYYNEDQSKLIAKGNNFYVWNNHDKESTYANLDDYATVYLFFQYLRLQSSKPDDIYREIQTSEYPDYRAVITAEHLNSTHKNNWSLLLRDWHAANYTNSASGLYGYMDDSTLKQIKAPMFSGGTTVSLYPGEGVYSKTSSAESVPKSSGNIKYSGLGSSGSTPNETTGFANGARLTYNVNTVLDKEGSSNTSETGSTTGIASTNIGVSLEKFTGSFKVDASYFNRRRGSSGIPESVFSSIINKNIHKFDITTTEKVFINE